MKSVQVDSRKDDHGNEGGGSSRTSLMDESRTGCWMEEGFTPYRGGRINSTWRMIR